MSKYEKKPEQNPLITKLPPQAKDMEVAVLGAIMLEKNAFEIAQQYLTADSFYSDAHSKVFKAMEYLNSAGQPIDVLTVVEQLKRAGDMDEFLTPYEVVKLTNYVVSSVNLEFHVKIVAQKHMLRRLISVSSDIINSAMEETSDAFEVLDSAEKQISLISTSTAQGGMSHISSVVMETMNKIGEWRKNDSTLTGVTTGFSELDRATRGWQNGDLIILAARPSVGKTALALNIIRNAAMNGNTCVGVWSMEMRAVFLVLRMLAAESDIILHKIQTGRLSDEEMQKLISKGADVLSKSNIFFDETSNVNIRSLKAKARRLKKKNKLGLIVIDYLQLMQGDNAKGNREQEISTISRELKNLAVELDVPIIALSQLSREGAKGVTWEVGPPVNALRESGAIEQDADLVLMLWGANETEQANDASLEGKRKLRIVKQRNGVLLTIELDFRSEIQLFESMKSYF